MPAIALFLAAVMGVIGATLVVTARRRSPPRRRWRAGRLRADHGAEIGDEAERWLKQQSPGHEGVPSEHGWYRASWFEGTGPFLWPAGYFAVLSGLLFLAGLYNPGELALVSVVVPLLLAIALVVGAYCHRRHRRHLIDARNAGLDHLFGEDAIARMLDRRRRGEQS